MNTTHTFHLQIPVSISEGGRHGYIVTYPNGYKCYVPTEQLYDFLKVLSTKLR